MDYFREMLNMGGNIMDAVNEAIEKNNYSGLTRNISDQVSQFTKAAGEDIRNKRTTYTKTTYNRNGTRTTYRTTSTNGSSFYGRPQDIDLGTRNNRRRDPQNQNAESAAGRFTGASTGAGYNAGQAYDERRKQQNASWNYSASNAGQKAANIRPNSPGTAITPFNQYKNKSAWTNGFLKQLAGGLGTVITAPTAAGLLIAGAIASAPAMLVSGALVGVGTGASVFLASRGSKQKKLSNTFEKYSKVVGSAEYTTIEDLASKVQEPTDLVEKNLDDLISAGMLPQAKFDTGKTTLMLTKNAYEQYLLAEESRKDREAKEAELDAKEGSQEAKKVISEGEAFLVKLRAANDSIPGQDMSDKLDQMERIVSKIFAQVRKEPASAGDLRKFMNYYLPTTDKLLNAYIELDKQPEVGENITNTKREIEGSIDTINNAFENLLDSLFQDVAWDITSDISVMKTMMEQDGLTKQKMDEATVTAEADVVSETMPDDTNNM